MQKTTALACKHCGLSWREAALKNCSEAAHHEFVDKEKEPGWT